MLRGPLETLPSVATSYVTSAVSFRAHTVFIYARTHHIVAGRRILKVVVLFHETTGQSAAAHAGKAAFNLLPKNLFFFPCLMLA